jgi:hypothetical protein
MQRTKSALVLNLSARMSYGMLKRWMDDHAGLYRVEALSEEEAARPDIAPQCLRVLPYRRRHHGSPLHMAWRTLISTVGRYDTFLVLCVSDEQVSSGHALYRVLAELLFSRSLILIGPNCVASHPSGFGVLRPHRAREVTMLALVGFINVLTTTVALAAVTAYEALSNLRRLQ